MQTVKVQVDGEEAYRIAAKCRACKVRFATEVKVKDFMWLGEAQALAQLEAFRQHGCDMVRERFSKHPAYLVVSSTFSWDFVRWGSRPGGKVSKCGAACLGAKGPDCDCACRGQHHGGKR